MTSSRYFLLVNPVMLGEKGTLSWLRSVMVLFMVDINLDVWSLPYVSNLGKKAKYLINFNFNLIFFLLSLNFTQVLTS